MNKILIIYPLFYNSGSIDRLYQYIQESNHDKKYLIEVLIINSNKQIHHEALKKTLQLKFKYILRDNFGGGEGAIFEIKNIHYQILESFDFAIYIEESCEPISRKWIKKLIKNLERGHLIEGWHWNWYAKNRDNSTKIKVGKYMNQGVICFNDENNKIITRMEFYDVFGFRHECLAFRVHEFLQLDIGNRELWLKDDKYFFGRSMERIYWIGGNLPKSPNFQFQLLKKQNKLPNFFNSNFKFFRELNFEEKNNGGYNIAPI